MPKVKKWLENYWYHYKWTTIVAVFLILVIGIGTFQMCTKEEYDIDILYTGPAILNEEQKRALATAFESVIPDEYDGDGGKTVMINDITILSDEQIGEKEAEAKAENDSLYYDYNSRDDAISQVRTLIMTGETVICLMDDFMYQKYKSQNAFVPLTEVLGSKPEYAVDEYSVHLKDTPFGQYFTACEALPDDTLLCVRKASVMAGGAAKEEADQHYRLCLDTFKAIFTFSVG